MYYEDKEVKCVGVNHQTPCQSGGTFILTGGEQKFYETKGMTEPKRCTDCRAKKKAAFDKRDARARREE